MRGPCRNCRFALKVGEDGSAEVLYYCHRDPPVPMPAGTMVLWPPVDGDAYCKDFAEPATPDMAATRPPRTAKSRKTAAKKAAKRKPRTASD